MAGPVRELTGSSGADLIDGDPPAPRRVLFVFLDGIGVGSPDPAVNPLAAANLPALRRILGGAPPHSAGIAEEPTLMPRSAARAIDASLGVAGLPQSGTGQTALLTGRNAPALLGRHFGPWVPTTLRDLLARENLFGRLRLGGHAVAVANAYPRAHFRRDVLPERRPGAVPLAAIAAGVLTRDEDSLRGGDALVSSITTDSWRRHIDPDAPVVDPADAGRLLARMAVRADLTFFAHFDTDYVGHRGSMSEAVNVLERVDELLGGVLETLGSDTLLVVTSDHGNVEDLRREHTTNAVPLLAVGAGSHDFVRRVSRIDEVAPAIEAVLRRE